MKKRTYFAALLPFLILAGMFEILPVFTIIVKSFMPESGDPGFTLQNYINIFSKPLYLTAIKNSLIISVVSAVIGLAVAFVGGRAACEKGGRPKRIFMSVLFPAFPWHFPSLFCWAMPGLSQSWDGTWELTPLLIFHSTQSGA